MKSLLKKYAWMLVTLFLVLNIAQAAVVSPVTVLTDVANQMLNSLAQNKAKLHNGDGVIYGIVRSVLLPHIDLDRMAMAVVGRQYWMSASPQQKTEFIDQFTHLVTSTYSAALASYNNDKVQFYPLRTDYTQSKVLTVRSVIIRQTGQKIAVDYNVIRDDDNWKVYDFSIENVSMVQSYRSQFADVLSRGGMNGLLQQLKAHNKNT